MHIYSCQEWGARPPLEDPFPLTNPTKIIIHNTASANRAPANGQAEIDAAMQLARDIQNDHMDNNHWNDTGQHFTNSRGGVVLEGRHGTLAAVANGQCVRGAHCAYGAVDENDNFGIENEGTYGGTVNGVYVTDVMPDAQWQSLVELCATLCLECNIDSANITGHRNTGIATDCPGDWLDAQLARLSQAVHDRKLALQAQPAHP